MRRAAFLLVAKLMQYIKQPRESCVQCRQLRNTKGYREVEKGVEGKGERG